MTPVPVPNQVRICGLAEHLHPLLYKQSIFALNGENHKDFKKERVLEMTHSLLLLI